MILAIDTGNTVMTAGLFSPEGTLYFRGSIKTDKNKTQDQLAIDLLDIFACTRRISALSPGWCCPAWSRR